MLFLDLSAIIANINQDSSYLVRMSQEQEKIQKYVIKSTPFGELNEVLKDLEKLSPLDVASPGISNAIQQYSEEHLALFSNKTANQANYAAMSCCKVAPGKYIDQFNKKIYTLDHLKGEIINSEDTQPQLVDSVQELLNHLSKAVAKYTATYYKDPFGSNVFMDLSEEALEIYIGITSKNVQLANFYTGEWVSKWKVMKGSIEGSITIKSHFFESGNVQFNQKKTVRSDFQFLQNMEESAKNIIKIIQRLQGEIQTNLSDVYEQMPNGFFKNLRRITPLTKTKMAWNINSIKMNRNLLDLKK